MDSVWKSFEGVGGDGQLGSGESTREGEAAGRGECLCVKKKEGLAVYAGDWKRGSGRRKVGRGGKRAEKNGEDWEVGIRGGSPRGDGAEEIEGGNVE